MQVEDAAQGPLILCACNLSIHRAAEGQQIKQRSPHGQHHGGADDDPQQPSAGTFPLAFRSPLDPPARSMRLATDVRAQVVRDL